MVSAFLPVAPIDEIKDWRELDSRLNQDMSLLMSMRSEITLWGTPSSRDCSNLAISKFYIATAKFSSLGLHHDIFLGGVYWTRIQTSRWFRWWKGGDWIADWTRRDNPIDVHAFRNRFVGNTQRPRLPREAHHRRTLRPPCQVQNWLVYFLMVSAFLPVAPID